MKIILSILTALLFFSDSYAQTTIDKSIILNGGTSGDRQIENLSEPDSLNDITTALTIQKNAGRFGTALGTDSLSISIPSGVQFYSPGNLIYFQAALNNSGPVQISVNNLPFFPLYVYGTEELKANQLKSGQVYCAVFSGTEFQLLSPVNNDCRTGFVEINSSYCMEQNERAAVSMWQAMVICNDNNARLCKWGEWYYACQKTGTGLLNMTGNWEWTDDAADANIRVAGNFACTTTGAIAPTGPYSYRCCYSK